MNTTMVRQIIFLVVITIFVSCTKKQEVIRKPFSINHKITCSDLVDQGYRWMPGEDVILLGKKSGDTLDYYQLDYETNEDDVNLMDEEVYEVAITQSENIVFDSVSDYDESDHLANQIEQEGITDSIFKSVYFDSSYDKSLICDGATPIWRCFKLLINAEDTSNLEKIFDQKSLTIYGLDHDSDLYIRRWQVVNSVSKDTFDCVIFEEGGMYFLESSIYLKR